jgi:hypothetical protein
MTTREVSWVNHTIASAPTNAAPAAASRGTRTSWRRENGIVTTEASNAMGSNNRPIVMSDNLRLSSSHCDRP